MLSLDVVIKVPKLKQILYNVLSLHVPFTIRCDEEIATPSEFSAMHLKRIRKQNNYMECSSNPIFRKSKKKT